MKKLNILFSHFFQFLRLLEIFTLLGMMQHLEESFLLHQSKVQAAIE